MRTVTYDRSAAVNLARNVLKFKADKTITAKGVRILCEAVIGMDAALAAHPSTSGDAEDAARLDRMESALDQIQAWASAYPIGMFPEPNWAASAKVLKDAGLSLDAISAANMRHVITRVQEIADNAMRASKGGE